MDEQIIFKYLSYDLKREIMLKMTPRDLQQVCKISKEMRNICDERMFWKDKIKEDFNITHTLGNLSHKETWIALHSKREYIINLDYYEFGTYAGEDTDEILTDILSESELKDLSKLLEETIKDYIIAENTYYFKYFEYKTDFQNNNFKVTLFSRVLPSDNDKSFYKRERESFVEYSNMYLEENGQNFNKNVDDDLPIGIVIRFS